MSRLLGLTFNRTIMAMLLGYKRESNLPSKIYKSVMYTMARLIIYLCVHPNRFDLSLISNHQIILKTE